MLKKFWQRFLYLFNKSLKREAVRPYIVPTRAGFAYGTFCFFMISLGFLYDNNLLYLQGFFLASVGIITMHLTNKNLASLRVSLKDSQDIFAMEDTTLTFVARSNHTPIREILIKSELEDLPVITFQNQQEFQLRYQFTKRGVQKLEPIQASSFYPFRLLYTWRYFLPIENLVVYPKKIVWPLERLDSTGLEDALGAHVNDTTDFFGHRPWIPAESFRRIDYRVKAKTGLLMTQDLRGSGADKLKLFFSETPTHMSFEDRLGVLTYWISRAEKLNKNFSVEVNNLKFEPGHNVKDVRGIYQHLATLEDFTV